MLSYLKIVVLLSFSYLSAQAEKVKAVYYDFDKYVLSSEQQQTIIDFIIKADTSKIASLEIYGYCDDRGTADYNYKLSQDRVNTVRELLIYHGINKNKIIVFKGKGRVVLTGAFVGNLSEIRSQNRRVDLMLVSKNNLGKETYNSFSEQHRVGDRIYLEKIYFPLGSSLLNYQSKKELDKIAKILNAHKSIEFEIIGHVCCTPDYYTDAIDQDTSKRKLSVNRAKSVFLYLMHKDVNSLRMSYKGAGNQSPLGKGKAFDRRVEFLITKI